jgi:hypothetical protein
MLFSFFSGYIQFYVGGNVVSPLPPSLGET